MLCCESRAVSTRAKPLAIFANSDRITNDELADPNAGLAVLLYVLFDIKSSPYNKKPHSASLDAKRGIIAAFSFRVRGVERGTYLFNMYHNCSFGCNLNTIVDWQVAGRGLFVSARKHPATAPSLPGGHFHRFLSPVRMAYVGIF